MTCEIARLIRSAGSINEADLFEAFAHNNEGFERFIARVDNLIGAKIIKRSGEELIWDAPLYLK